MRNNRLKDYFPVIREKEEIRREIENNLHLREKFGVWNHEQQELFLDFCSGVRGVKMLYDSFFKEIMNPEYTPERLNELLSLLIGEKVTIKEVLPNDSVRIADESSLVILDMVVELNDGSIANVEVQKLGYKFPGERAACYSADLLLRQYRRVKSASGKVFSYRNIKTVYTIVLYEKSPEIFKEHPERYLYEFCQRTDIEMEINLLQRYVFVSLDIFINMLHNKGITSKLEAWLTFLASDVPEDIIMLVEEYPEFKELYEDVYAMCMNTEKVMNMFSKELAQLDKNTVQYMIDEMQDEIDGMKQSISEKDSKIDGMKQQLEEKDREITDVISEKDGIISEKDGIINEKDGIINDKDREIAILKEKLKGLV